MEDVLLSFYKCEKLMFQNQWIKNELHLHEKVYLVCKI